MYAVYSLANEYVIVGSSHWELAVQIHMNKIKGYPKESLWPRDILFRYYQLQERLQENIQERKEILDLFMQCMVNDHDS